MEFEQLLRAEEVVIIRNLHNLNTGERVTKFCPGLFFPDVNRILTFHIYCSQVHRKSQFKLRNIKKIIFKNLCFDFLIIPINFTQTIFRRKTFFIKKSELDEINENIMKQLFYNDELERIY